MTELITLNLTLKELQQIDKFVEINDDTLSVLEKIKDAYPQQKSPAEEAYKRVYCRYPDKYGASWDIFEKGYARAQKDYKVGEYEPTSPEPEENEWRTVALRFGEKLSAIGPCGYYGMTADEWLEWVNGTYEKNADELLPLVNRGIMKNKVKEYEPTPQERGDRIYKEVEKLLEKNWYVDAKDLIESETSPQEPTSTVFRQKLFDGIKSVFYDPEYERIHWKMKVNMAVDEVLTHFYDIIPDEDDAPYSGYDKGWNRCIKTIKECMEHTDDGN